MKKSDFKGESNRKSVKAEVLALTMGTSAVGFNLIANYSLLNQLAVVFSCIGLIYGGGRLVYLLYKLIAGHPS